MRATLSLGTALVALVQAAAAVTGAAEGFAKGVTGGGSATTVYPKTNAELISYLGDSSPRNIVLTKTFDFIGTEGTLTSSGCAPWGTGALCQTAISQNDWCKNYEPKAPVISKITYDGAARLGITVKSNKSLIGQGNKGVIRGKGLRIVSGAKNIILQNIHITELNPKYVWGGDAITINNADLIWIDHVTTSKIGRQHIVLGTDASNRVTISNCDIDGRTSWSATCDNHHYWALYFTGSNDMVTLKGNYIHHVSGRAPKVSGNTLLHAVNNYFYDVSGHAFEADKGSKILAEGNIFQNVKAPAQDGLPGQVFAAPSTSANAACSASLGRACQMNAYGSSGTLNGADTSFLSSFKGKNIASAASANDAKKVTTTAGFGKI